MAAALIATRETRQTIATGLTVRIERDPAVFAPIWIDLEARYESAGLATSWSWTGTWLAAFGDAIEHWFAIAEHDGQPVGIALLTRGQSQRRGPLPVRTIHIGTAGETPGEGVWIEYNRILAAPEHKAAFLTRLCQAPGVRLGTADVLQLDGFAPEELVGVAGARGKRIARTCYAAHLSPAADPIDSFDRETRRKLRNGIRRFTDEFGALQIEWVTEPGRAGEVLAELIDLHQERWTTAGEPGAFASVRFRAFHDQLVRKRIASQGVVLVRVTAGEHLIGVFYGLVERGVIFHYQWGLAPFTDNRLAPGFITGYLVLNEARQRGFTELNWLAGDSRYKKDLSTVEHSLIWMEVPLSPWMHTVSGLISAKRTLRGRR